MKKNGKWSVEVFRKKNPCGKAMVAYKYIHRSAVDRLSDEEYALYEDRVRYLPEDFLYDIVRVDLKKENVGFTQSPDWDVGTEPFVGQSYLVKADGTVIHSLPHSDPQIYHHKWMFVTDDYEGFDVEAAKAWSEVWENHPRDYLKTLDYLKIKSNI